MIHSRSLSLFIAEYRLPHMVKAQASAGLFGGTKTLAMPYNSLVQRLQSHYQDSVSSIFVRYICSDEANCNQKQKMHQL